MMASHVHSLPPSLPPRLSGPLHMDDVIEWDYDPNALLRDGDSGVGLQNQGGTCYMNAFLQQVRACLMHIYIYAHIGFTFLFFINYHSIISSY